MKKVSAQPDTTTPQGEGGFVRTRIAIIALIATVAVVVGPALSSPGAAASPGAQPSVKVAAAVPAPLRGDFAIQNKLTGRCADVPGFGRGTPRGPVNQFTCDFRTTDNQRWTFIPRGPARGGSGTEYNQYEIRNAKDGLCLDVPGTGANPDGTLVSEYYCVGPNDNQRWYTVERHAPDGRIGLWIVNTKSKKCLDVAGHHAGNDARLTLFKCSDAASEDHYWRVTRHP